MSTDTPKIQYKKEVEVRCGELRGDPLNESTDTENNK